MMLARLYYTLRPLRAVQWTNRLTRRLRARTLRPRRLGEANLQAAWTLPDVVLPHLAPKDFFDPKTGEACFLHLPHRFDPTRIDWNFSGYGLLWTYHLHYFGWIEDLDDAPAVLAAVQDYCRNSARSGVAGEVYPASRRVQHWIGAMLRHGVRDAGAAARLYEDAWRIARLPERHLQANHLLQNGLAVFAAAHFFEDAGLYRRAERILTQELREQFFSDGGHIERSASYATDLCARMVWCLHLQTYTQRFQNSPLTAQLRAAAQNALSWLTTATFSDGSYAAVGDSSEDMMPPLADVAAAAGEVGITPRPVQLRESGFRKIVSGGGEAVLNIGLPGPSYQPGHSHADALTFCLHAHGRPLIVDTGISTYERNARRLYERGTPAHNTVVVGEENSSDVWASFRMGRRAVVKILDEGSGQLTAQHDGYESFGVLHVRSFDWREENCFSIQDVLAGSAVSKAVSFLHFHPDITPENLGDGCWRAGSCTIEIKDTAEVTAESYAYAAGFNRLRPALRLRCVWKGDRTGIYFRF